MPFEFGRHPDCTCWSNPTTCAVHCPGTVALIKAIDREHEKGWRKVFRGQGCE